MKKRQYENIMAELTAMRDEMHAMRRILEAMKAARGHRACAPKRAVTRKDAVRRIHSECAAAGITEAAFSMRTLQRMERGEAPRRSGYTAEMRTSWVTFNTWLANYIAEEKSKLHWDRAVSYREDLQAHQVAAN